MRHQSLMYAPLAPENRPLLESLLERDLRFRLEPETLYPILFRPCRVRVLLVADGALNFSQQTFGLSTFVSVLQQTLSIYVRFEITVAHINNVSDDEVMLGAPGIARSIKMFKFDDPAHFSPTMYDQVWLFGILTQFNRGPRYPTTRLSDAELRNISEFMDQGGGLFATGDHGALGVCLSGSIPRARSMRIWQLTPETGMDDERRNDTNRLGHDPSSSFDDQSDDVPQPISPKLYSRWYPFWRFIKWPHPLLCGPKGVIRVLPDHPHEGECIEPTDTGRQDTLDGYTITEYPGAPVGSRPLPEVIATSTVLAGSTADTKDPTQAHAFGAICTYDGHRAGVGRVVTDATWHHFVNINLVGRPGPDPLDPKTRGFLASLEGEAHFEQIKSYYRNIAIWIARPSNHVCFRRRICWWLLWHHRIIESVTYNPNVKLKTIDIATLFMIGRHARDVLGRWASQCQSERFIIDLIRPQLPPHIIDLLDPWAPRGPRPPRPGPDPLPWFDPEPLFDLALGGALVALREAHPDPSPETRDRAEASIDEIIAVGVSSGVTRGLKSMATAPERFVTPFTSKRAKAARPAIRRKRSRK